METKTTTGTTTPAAIHPWELHGLGKAPFRCTGSYESKYQACHGAPIQPGTTCDYCGQGIMIAFTIKSADGKAFKVGCDCVANTTRACAKTELERDARKLVDAVNKIKTASANKRKDDRIAVAQASLETHRELLSGIWHSPPPAKHAKTVAEHLDWMFANAGRAGKIKAAAELGRWLGARS